MEVCEEIGEELDVGLMYLSLLFLMLFWGLSFVDSIFRYYSLFRKTILVLFVASLGIIAYTWQPKETDLTRQFILLENIRRFDGSLIDFLLDPDIGGHIYATLYAYNIYRYIIAKLFTGNSMLPFLTIIIDYSIFVYILFDYRKSRVNNGMVPSVCLAICFGCLPFLFAVSGIRNGLASSIMAYAIYGYIYKRRKMVFFIVLSAIAILIHPSSIMAVPFALMSKWKLGWKGILAIFFGITFINRLAVYLAKTDIEFLRRIGTYYIAYTSASYYLYYDIFVLLVLILSFIICYRYIEDELEKQLYYFIFLYSVATMGFLGNYDMILRPCYLLGALSPVTGTLIVDVEIWPENLWWLRRVIIVSISMLGLYIFLRYMRYFYTWSNNQLFFLNEH